MTASDISLLLGVLAAACVLAAIPAHRTGRESRDVRLMVGIAAVLGLGAGLLLLA